MERLLQMLFFKIHSILKDEFSALCAVTVLVSFNILTIIGYVRILVLRLDSILLPNFYTLLITLSLGVGLYLMFLFRGRFLENHEEFKASTLNGAIGIVYTKVYMALTIISLAVLAII